MYVYILYSKTLDKFYAGISAFKQKRLRQHRNGQTRWTSRADDGVELWATSSSDYASARMIEKAIKARGARRFLNARGVATPLQAG